MKSLKGGSLYLFLSLLVFLTADHPSYCKMKSFLSILSLCFLSQALAAPSRPLNAANGITSDPSVAADKAFDYIIAGGGLTGLTVASRVSEDPSISVLVIEAGQDDHADPRVNDVRTYGQAFDTELDHAIYSTPVQSQDSKGLLLVAGKTLGGSGSINGASWTKGPRTQYDVLPILTGDDSWGWDGLNEFMLEAEHFNLPEEDEIADGAQWIDSAHGTEGKIEVSFAEGLFGGIQQPALEANEKVWPGLQRIPDAASGVANGATIIPNMLADDDNQNRSSPFTAYAQYQVQERPNLTILTGHRVTEILWKEGSNDALTASGVRFQACASCPNYKTSTKREVLLAAGSLQSPQILELSGVGDPAILSAAGIDVKLAAPGVGKNMQEQTKNTLVHTPQSTEFGGSGPPAAISFPNVHQLFGGEEKTAEMYNDIISSLPTYAADLESRGLVTNANATETILKAQVDNLFQSSEPAAEIFFTTNPQTGKVGIDAWNLIVLSRGSVHIQSANAWDHPIAEPNYFGHDFDLAVQVAACKQSREVFTTSPLAELIQSEDQPGDLVTEPSHWEDWVKGSFTSVWHYIATLAMMKEELGGVVDERLRVYGVRNVRAVDASALPIQLSAHLSSSLYGIAEKAAVMIKEDQL